MSVFDLAVIGRDAESQAAVAALRLAGGRARSAVVISDRGGGVAALGVFATPAARRLARLPAADGVETCARGRIAFVRPQRDALVSVARRTAARAGAPVVVALSQPRDEYADVLLAESLSVVVLANPDGPVARLALAQLATIGVFAECRHVGAGPAVSLARLGWSASREAQSHTAAWEGA